MQVRVRWVRVRVVFCHARQELPAYEEQEVATHEEFGCFVRLRVVDALAPV